MRGAPFLNLVLAVALALMTGWLLLGEAPTLLQAAGLVTVLCGFYLAQRQR